MPNVITAFWWVVHNKGQVLTDVALVVAAASALIKSLEVLARLVATLFPQVSIVGDELDGLARWLDALARSPVLNKLALSPKPVSEEVAEKSLAKSLVSGGAIKTLAVVLALSCFWRSGEAQASPLLVSSGPTLPLMEYRPGYAHPVNLAAGAGYQLSLTLPQLQRTFGSKAWDLLDVSGMVFGSAVSSQSGQTFGALSVALSVCTLSSLLCLGGGRDVVSAGLGSPWFALFAFSLNFDMGAQVNAAASLPRGNHFAF